MSKRRLSSVVKNVYNFDYKGQTDPFELVPGTYQLELWGASGGYKEGASGKPGYGGYVTCDLFLHEKTKIFINVGGQGMFISGSDRYLSVSGGFNGGGSVSNVYYPAGGMMISAGGSSDIRIGENSIYHRAIVAGGGSSAHPNTESRMGAAGGGLIGKNPLNMFERDALGGSQMYGGRKGNDQYTPGQDGRFFYGGSATQQFSGAGGGGWYGGGSGAPSGAGGGGSSFYWAHETRGFVPAGYKVSPKYFMENCYTLPGDTDMPSPYNSSTMVGNFGNGYVRISKIDAKYVLVYLHRNSCQVVRKTISLSNVLSILFYN